MTRPHNAQIALLIHINLSFCLIVSRRQHIFEQIVYFYIVLHFVKSDNIFTYFNACHFSKTNNNNIDTNFKSII